MEIKERGLEETGVRTELRVFIGRLEIGEGKRRSETGLRSRYTKEGLMGRTSEPKVDQFEVCGVPTQTK